jgi:hypothetical protein
MLTGSDGSRDLLGWRLCRRGLMLGGEKVLHLVFAQGADELAAQCPAAVRQPLDVDHLRKDRVGLFSVVPR